ncbi:IS66 family insertion sequence element accessory protein TnpB [Paenibacillus alkaliterrae]|uniref:IS66 family insertion sequence element accessory protein TnpA n=1 Tax=Paenibacillus alkaliterrae TaxID=320909 RepID=UPI001F4479FD|nr:IS66 family insertion sequence element accessory protein TnpB [Paenibacillus alkaliterrae]MCF2937177.1 IS66 family insertion sequence element accessory protein TnpB [Paenibacillus alkaliterrae]
MLSPKEQRQREWEVRVSDFKSSGLKMTHWCSANHVSLEQMKYWTRKFKTISAIASIAPSKSFIPLIAIEPAPRTATSSLVVQVGFASIELHPGFDPQLLREAVEAISRSC